METKPKAPAIVHYLSSILTYCPEEGAFYSSSVFHGEAKGELNGSLVYGKRQTIIDQDSGRLLIRAGNKYNRRAVHAAKLAWFMTHGEWPYFIGHKYGLDDLRILGLKALMTIGEYQATMGDLTYWQRAYAAMPELSPERPCMVQWFPGLSPEVEEK